jgi:hypothetical protein
MRDRGTGVYQEAQRGFFGDLNRNSETDGRNQLILLHNPGTCLREVHAYEILVLRARNMHACEIRARHMHVCKMIICTSLSCQACQGSHR